MSAYSNIMSIFYLVNSRQMLSALWYLLVFVCVCMLIHLVLLNSSSWIVQLQNLLQFFCVCKHSEKCYFAFAQDVFHERIKTYKMWKDAETTLGKKRENKAKLEMQNKLDKIPQAQAEITEVWVYFSSINFICSFWLLSFCKEFMSAGCVLESEDCLGMC